MNEQTREYYQAFAKHLARKIVPSEEIKSFVGGHATLVGAFAEAQVRKFVRQVVAPLRVSHGAVIAPESYGAQRARQVDTIIWTPNPLPALFEVDDFALIPWMNSMGVVEIKSSAYKGVGKAIDQILEMECDLTLGRRPKEKRGIPAALGVVVLWRKASADSRLAELITDRKAVVLLHQEGDQYHADTEAMLRFVNFLADVRRRASQLGGLKLGPLDHTPFVEDTRTSC